MATKRLHELIELARAGKKFKARILETSWVFDDWFLSITGYDVSHVMAEWEYIEIREPQVLEFVFDCREHEPDQAMNKDITYDTYLSLDKKKWRIVATEILEEEEI